MRRARRNFIGPALRDYMERRKTLGKKAFAAKLKAGEAAVKRFLRIITGG